MWHILQETFGARNNCKAVAFVSRKEKQKKRTKKEKAEGRVRKEPPASLGFSPLHWPAHLTPGRLPFLTDPVATGARSPRTASPSTTRGRIRPPRPRRLGPLPCAPLTPLLSSVAHSPLGSPQIPFPPPPRRGRRRASPVPAATEPRSPHRRVPRLRQRRLLRLHPRTGVGELHNVRIEPPPSASAAVDLLQLRPPSAAPNLSPAFLSHSVSSSPSPFSHVGRPLL